jgi:hypothetical protein
MIEPVSGLSEVPSPTSTNGAMSSAISSIAQTLAAEKTLTSLAGAKEAATRHSSETTAPSRQPLMHARSLGAIDDAVVRNLLDSLSADSRVAGSFFLADREDAAPRSLIATYYDDV